MIAFLINSLISIGLIVMGIKNLLNVLLIKKYTPTNAKIVSFDYELDAEHLIKYPVIEFFSDGKRIISKVQYGISFLNWKKGKEVKVFYKPNNPDNFFMWNFKINVMSLVSIAIGIFFLVIGFKFI